MEDLFIFLTDQSGIGAYAVILGILIACGLGFPLPEDIPLTAAGYLVFGALLLGTCVIFYRRLMLHGSRGPALLSAGAGLLLVLRSQHNAWIHAVATLLVLALAVLFPLSGLEWCVLLIAIGLVWSAEAMNTALELLADAVSPDRNPLIGQAKDAAAGAVLVAALVAAAVGIIVLGPHCLAFFEIAR